MHRSALVLLLFAPLAFGQAAKPASTAPAGKPAAPAAQSAPAAATASPSTAAAGAVAPSAPVITIEVPCAAKASAVKAAGTQCKESVSRADFDRLVSAIAPDLPAPMRRQLAQQYAQIMAFASRARAKGLESDPKVQELFKFTRMNVLAKYFVQQLQKQAEDVPDSQLESYYNSNKDKFQQAKLERIFIPKPFGKEATPDQQKAIEQLAQKIQARAAAGEDMSKLEDEAFAQVKANSNIPEAEKSNYTAPKVDIGEIRRGRLPEAHESKVFALDAGQVSPVITEPSGYFIYKVISKQQVPLADAKAEIKETLARQRFEEELKGVERSASPVFNEAYFGAGEKTAPKGAAGAPEPEQPKTEAPKEPEPAPKL